MPRNRKRKRRKRKYIALQLILMILIKTSARARAGRREENFANWKTRLNLKEIPREFSFADGSFAQTIVCLAFVLPSYNTVVSIIRNPRLLAVCNRSYTARKILSSSFARGRREECAEDGIEDVERRDASHSIIISLPAFPKDCTTLARIQSNAIGD